MKWSFVQESEKSPGIKHYRVEVAGAVAEISAQGATLTEWRPVASEASVIYTSPDARYEPGKAIRGGVPLCWPWFSKHPTDPSAPAHGLVRTRLWELVDAEELGERVRLVFVPEAGDDLPEGIELRYEVYVGAELELRLCTVNRRAESYDFSQALHAYFEIGELTSAKVFGLEGSRYVDTLCGHAEHDQVGTLELEDAIDAIYRPNGGEFRLEDPALGRELRLSSENSRTLIVWNPGEEGAKSVSDLRASEYGRFVCLEPANLGDDEVSLPAGEEAVLAMRVKVEH